MSLPFARSGLLASSQQSPQNHPGPIEDFLKNITTPTAMNTIKIPQHVAFICDGNSRWAHRRGLDTRHGHVQGADRLVQLLEQLKEDRISYCTLYGFSTENWRRPTEEIQEIFGVMEATARTLLPRLFQDGTGSSIRIRILGDLHDERIPRGLRMILQELQRITDQHQQKEEDLTNGKAHILTVCLAINYGGRQDIVHATKKLVAAIQAGELSLQDLDKNDAIFASYLSTAGIPDPDLIVRTSGEHRLSNFLLWNSAYSEFYVTDTLWPDFDIESWHGALEWYQQRSRRFGSRESRSTEM